MKIGIDFGSTYSTVAVYNSAADAAEAISLAEGQPKSIPSVVSCKSIPGSNAETLNYGHAAKNLIAGKRARIFEAFKMLIAASDAEMLKKRGYDDRFTPAFITGKFLEHLIEGTLKRCNPGNKTRDGRVDNLVICVPEVWCRNAATRDGRQVLRKILRDDVGIEIDNIKIVTEPEAASAYFAHGYEAEMKKPFNGHLLLIDYGGGTLDITLTEVRSDGMGTMEICYRDGGGEGENHPKSGTNGVIGCAGIAFMQNIVLRAVKNSVPDFNEESVNFGDPTFAAAVCELENELKSTRNSEIEDKFDQYGSYASVERILKEENPGVFTYIDYDGYDVPISYKDLYLSYKEVIEPVLSEQIAAINEKVERHTGKDPTRPDSGSGDDFKIAFVGGFSSFFLVKKQLAEIYNLDSEMDVDPRTRHLSADSRENAIALGAALIAADRVTLQRTARFSIGLFTKRGTRYENVYYGIKCHQIIEPNELYYLRYKNGDIISWGGLKDNIKEFAIEFTERTDYGRPMKCKREILDKLDELPVYGFWKCAFSMDEKDVITFHVVPNSTALEGDEFKPLEIELDSYQRMFELSDVKEVRVGNEV